MHTYQYQRAGRKDTMARRYMCGRCRTPITFDRVEVMTDRTILYTCECLSGGTEWRRYQPVDDALAALFGENICPEVPYSAAPRPLMGLRMELENESASFVRAWRHIESVEQFILLCTAGDKSAEGDDGDG